MAWRSTPRPFASRWKYRHSLTAEIDEFKGAWRAIVRIAPERLSGLRRVEVIAETKPVASRLTLDSATYEVDFRWHQHGRRQPVAR